MIGSGAAATSVPSFGFSAGSFAGGGFSEGALAGDAFSDGLFGVRDERVAGAEPCPRAVPTISAKQRIAPAAPRFLIRLHSPGLGTCRGPPFSHSPPACLFA